MNILKKTKVFLLFLITLITLPFLYYYLLDDICLNHPFETTYIDDEKNVIVSTLQEKKGIYITYEEIPQKFIDCLICIEDKSFYSHKGINIKRLFKATINNIFSSNSQGGSTITMQLARMLYLNNDKTILRKIRELFYAFKLENNLAKEKIIEYYLNCTYFAHGIYGLRTASFFYFNKNVDSLTLYESAMLIGILNSPNNYSPFIDLKKSQAKTLQILQTLQKNNIITTEEYYEAFNQKLVLANNENKSITGLNNYYLDACLKEIDKKKLISKSNYRYGLKIETFLNITLQNYIENLIKKIDFDIYDVAVVVMETNTAKVISLVGGKNYDNSSFNRAVNAKKQIGSTIKPLLYYLALLNGFTPLTELESKKTTFHIKNYGDYNVSNASDKYANRKITMLEAIAMSDNIYAVKTLLSLGTTSLKNLLNDFSINVDVDNITLALGANSMSLLELTAIYNCIASGGMYYQPKFIKKISLGDTTNIYSANYNQGKRVLFKKECEVIRSLLRAPFDKALKTYANPSLMNYYVSENYGAKTGSTESSSWVIGFSKKYTIGVYVGSDDNTYLTKGSLSREIFYQISKYLDEKKSEYFTPTSNLQSFNLYNTLSNQRSFNYFTN